MADFASRKAIRSCKQELLFCDNRQEIFDNHRLALFSEYVEQTLAGFDAEKHSNHSIEDLASLFEKEKAFVQAMHDNHFDLKTSLWHAGNQSLTDRQDMYSRNPAVITEFARDYAFLQEAGIPLHEMLSLFQTVNGLMEGELLQEVQSDLFNRCCLHLENSVEADLSILREQGHLEKWDELFHSERHYLQSVCSRDEYAPYLSETSLEKDLERLEQEQVIEQTRQLERHRGLEL